jgi:histone deacetylase 1/2
VSGYKYYLVILDDCSQYTRIFPLRLKSDTFANLFHFFAYVGTQFDTSIKGVQCDNSCEFDNNVASSFFLSHMVNLGLSCPYTLAQNGGTERTIPTFNNFVHFPLFQASMLAQYWVDTLLVATPSYSHLRVFGCFCYPNLSATSPHKLPPCSSLCFLGIPFRPQKVSLS